MFAAKMVCLIQKLFGRDDECPAAMTTREIDGQPTAEQQGTFTSSEDPRHCGNNADRQHKNECRDVLDGTELESDGLTSKDDLHWSFGSQSISLPSSSNSRLDIDDERIHNNCAFVLKNQQLPIPSDILDYASSSILESRLLPRKSRFSDSTAAEPVCCCDACMFISDSIAAQQDTRSLVSSCPGDYSISSEHYDSASVDWHSTYTLPSFSVSSNHLNPPSPNFYENTSVHKLSTTAPKRTVHGDKVPSTTKQLSQVENLPPMIRISWDGEEGFANSQRLLEHARRCKPFSEVPPNKTICHISCKSVKSK